MSRNRAWVWTVFASRGCPLQIDYSQETVQSDKGEAYITYIVYQREICPVSHEVHFQGYVETSCRVTMKQMKILMQCSSLHLEVRQGSQTRAIEYCKKEASRDPAVNSGPFDFGVPAEDLFATHRTHGDDDLLRNLLDELQANGGCLTWALMVKYPSITSRNLRFLDRCIMQIQNQCSNQRVITCYAYCGKGGVGKTFAAFMSFRREETFILTNRCNSPQLWFDGYRQQPVLIIDEFQGGAYPPEVILQLTSGLPCPLNVKGGTTTANWTTVIVTSNIHPHNWWSSQIDNPWLPGSSYYEALSRRFPPERIIDMSGMSHDEIHAVIPKGNLYQCVCQRADKVCRGACGRVFSSDEIIDSVATDCRRMAGRVPCTIIEPVVDDLSRHRGRPRVSGPRYPCGRVRPRLPQRGGMESLARSRRSLDSSTSLFRRRGRFPISENRERPESTSPRGRFGEPFSTRSTPSALCFGSELSESMSGVSES